MQVMRAVGAMQSDGHGKPHGSRSIVPAPSASSGQALAKNARTGHPEFRNGKATDRKPGPPVYKAIRTAFYPSIPDPDSGQ